MSHTLSAINCVVYKLPVHRVISNDRGMHKLLQVTDVISGVIFCFNLHKLVSRYCCKIMQIKQIICMQLSPWRAITSYVYCIHTYLIFIYNAIYDNIRCQTDPGLLNVKIANN